MSLWELLQLHVFAPSPADFVIDNFIIEPRVASVDPFPACISSRISFIPPDSRLEIITSNVEKIL